MIRRTLQGGLLATVALLAFLSTAAGVAAASTTAPRMVPAIAAQQYAPRTHHIRHHVHHRRHHAHRAHRLLRLTLRDMAPGSTVRGVRYHRGLPLTGRVTTHRLRLNVRSGPGTGYRVVGHRRAHRLVALSCKAYGSSVYGNRLWYRLPHHRGYVSAHYVRTGRAVPWC